MSKKGLMRDFDYNWGEDAKLVAVQNGVPKDLAEKNSNLRLIGGKLVAFSYGDGSAMGEATEAEWRALYATYPAKIRDKAKQQHQESAWRKSHFHPFLAAHPPSQEAISWEFSIYH